jgi:uncharacterized small protein (DUF1192 family)
MELKIALFVSMACNCFVLGMFLIMRARVANFFKTTQNLDWQSVADITGDIGALKRSIQRLNNRLNGMEKTASNDALSELRMLHEASQQPNVTPIQQVRGG